MQRMQGHQKLTKGGAVINRIPYREYFSGGKIFMVFMVER